ncbi:Hypothetical protein LUCI_3729 [Lucifera butyrica]|uniref:HTH cro/C1-type domain-containing protein n=1 Tax=Lucifera butyrica TaxID=1351585 RepID=A0A498RC11_9FIRM|nr:helix-turn-helix transcriptional regulator [Lucifera butyrica]VBB08457.1 Hypothetical protein LUCI_3729 [Lucifera butyrica]
MHNFNTRFRLLVNNSGFTTERLSDLLGVTRYQIYNWMNGRGEPDIETLGRIRRFFDISYDYLVGDIEDKCPVNPDLTLDPKAQEMIAAYRKFLRLEYPVNCEKIGNKGDKAVGIEERPIGSAVPFPGKKRKR